ncbi:MAG: hypothetical protein LIO63_08310 [Akkermansia sp.]|nr:hypothetical protein [Akkermansia sp.]
MHPVFRILGVLVGMWLIFAVIRSCCRVALVNVPSPDSLTGFLSRLTYRLMLPLLRRRTAYPERQRILAWFGPLFLLSSIGCYFAVTMAGFGLIYQAIRAETTFSRSLVSSGSALSTLGFSTPATSRGEAVAIVEGAVGLGIVVFLITFVPGYQSAIQRREEISARLYAHTGGEPSCEALLGGADKPEPAFWNAWEDFLRELGDIHAESPILVFTPSIRAGQSWVVSVFAVLDAANFTGTMMEGGIKRSSGICLREGILSLRRMAAALRMEQSAAQPASLSPGDFDALCSRLEAGGLSIQSGREAARPAFEANRAQYEPILRFLAETLFVPLPPSLTRLTRSPHPPEAENASSEARTPARRGRTAPR